MLGDLEYDVVNRDVVLTDGDFTITNLPSAQNGGIIQWSKCAFLRNPVLGIGLAGAMGSPLSTIAYEMSRWQQQCNDDGASHATYSFVASDNDYANVKIQTNIAYR